MLLLLGTTRHYAGRCRPPLWQTSPSPSKDDNPGILYEDLWDLSVLKPFDSFLNPEEPHCPVLAASARFSRSVTSQPTSSTLSRGRTPSHFPLWGTHLRYHQRQSSQEYIPQFPPPRNLLSSAWSRLAGQHWFCIIQRDHPSSRPCLQAICVHAGCPRTAASELVSCCICPSPAFFYSFLPLLGGTGACIPVPHLLDEHENSDKANPRNREPGCINTIEYVSSSLFFYNPSRETVVYCQSRLRYCYKATVRRSNE
jgi:hypothetical protein